uniref:BTB domain-containing protein n=1 Tax=Panagrolaimus sp. PS1159 TaxID=55785 RepID=A0AC35FLT6_9BILA
MTIKDAALASMAKARFELFRSQDLQNGLFDVAFNIGGKIIYAHKFVLGSVSSTLKEKFLLRMRLQNNDPITIDDCSFGDFYDLLTFLYSGKYDLNDKNLVSIADISDKYAIKQLQLRCNDYLTNAEYSSKNFVELFERFNEHPSFVRAFRIGMMKKYPYFLLSPNFLLAKKKTVKAILALDRPFKHEEKLFIAVYQWAEARAKHIQQATDKNDNCRARHFVKVEYDDDCMVIDEVIVTPERQPSSNGTTLNEIIKNELTDILPKIHFNAMTKEFVTSYVVSKNLKLKSQISKAKKLVGF